MDSKKKWFMIFLMIIFTLVILGCSYIIYKSYKEEKKKSEIKHQVEPVRLPIKEKKTNDEKTNKIPTLLNEDTQKLVDKIAATTGEKTKITNTWIFNVLLEEISVDNEIIGYDGGDLYEISKDDLLKKLNFLSKGKNLQEVINVQNDKDANYFNYKIKEQNGKYIVTIPGHENGDNVVELTNKETENNKLILTYKVSCYGGDSSSYYIGETTVTLDYIDNEFSLNNTKFRSNGLNVTCH